MPVLSLVGFAPCDSVPYSGDSAHVRAGFRARLPRRQALWLGNIVGRALERPEKEAKPGERQRYVRAHYESRVAGRRCRIGHQARRVQPAVSCPLYRCRPGTTSSCVCAASTSTGLEQASRRGLPERTATSWTRGGDERRRAIGARGERGPPSAPAYIPSSCIRRWIASAASRNGWSR